MAKQLYRYNLEGQTFGRLTVLERAEKQNKRTRWFCRCECGNKKIVQQTHLLTGHSRGCGVCDKYKSKYKYDLTGNVFGNLKVIGSASKRGGAAVWLCEATPCGHSLEIRQTHLVSGRNKNCSICKPRESAHPNWSGCGDISGNFLWQIKNNAKTRGLDFTVTDTQLWEKFQAQEGRCVLSGLEISVRSWRGRKRGVYLRPTASLDRIDSTLGYTPENIQWVHKDVNRCKQNLAEADFIRLCEAVTNQQKIKTC